MNKEELMEWRKEIFSFRVIARVTIADDDDGQLTTFEERLKQFSAIEMVLRLPGKAILILFIAVKDQRAYAQFLAGELNKNPGISRVDSTYMQSGFQSFAAYDGYPCKRAIQFKNKINMAIIDFITRDDLEKFKQELFAELHKMNTISSPEQTAKKWLKSVEVRQLLKISAGTLQNLRINGTINYTKVGSLLYYKYEDIVKLLEGTPVKKFGR